MRSIEKSSLLPGNGLRQAPAEALEFPYGESNIGLWHEAAAIRGRGRGGASSGEAYEWARGARYHARARGQQGRDRKAVAPQPGGVLRTLSRDLGSGREIRTS